MPWHGAYEVPDVARCIINLILTERERRLVAAFVAPASVSVEPGGNSAGIIFSAADAQGALCLGSEAESRELLDSAYRRGVVSIARDGTRDDSASEGATQNTPSHSPAYSMEENNRPPKLYRIGNFFSRLDIVSVAERDAYLSIPEEIRDALESLYFDRYYSSLDWDKDGGRPTTDAVLTLDETLDLIEAKNAEGKNIYRVNCDCRSLRDGCGHLKDVCITFDDGTNTWPDRGIAEKLSLDDAKKTIMSADKDGLIHTSNPRGICNCCTDCCYLFRSRKRRDSGRVWPASNRMIDIAADVCVGCGRCVKRCPLDALSLAAFDTDTNREKKRPISMGLFRRNKKAVRDDKACVGCGLCISSCKFGALSLSAV